VTKRLLLSYLGLATLMLLILAVPLATLAQRFERQLATAQAAREANGLVAVVGDSLERSQMQQLQSVVSSYQQRTGAELTLVSVSGSIIVTSSTDGDDDARTEWAEVTHRALGGQPASAFSDDEGEPYAVASAPVLEDGRLVAAVVVGSPATLTERRIHEIWLAIGLFAAGAIVVAGVAGLVLARSLADPLSRLEATVNRFGRGDLSIRALETRGPVEVRSLAHRFNQMAARLDDAISAQKRFVGDASHQLRSPLTALRLRLENLEATSDAASAEALSEVNREVLRLSRLVDGLLILSRGEDTAPKLEPVDVTEVITERCEAWSALAAERSIRIEFDPGASRTHDLHPGDLDQILDNYLSNAVEVSEPGSRILVSLEGSPGEEQIHVVDQGPGLSDADRRRAFDRFWQGGDHQTGHSGLGLAIAHQLAVRNGISVELRPAVPYGLDAVIDLSSEGKETAKIART
jgi:signal transduction histidine kinase